MPCSGKSFSWRRKRIGTMTDRIPEILAPCGTPAAFHAALNAGADAMYMALKQFGARAYADNFTQDELLHALEEAHLHERKIYLTLNTLLKDEELAQVPELLEPLYLAGLDAVLIQDMGLYRLLREAFPLLPLHASTQMNICSVPGARYAKELGFTRVVPARELSLSELKAIRDEAGIEVEAFVHGAMCYCYSGRCYLSSFLGGRSGNRGRCAQPCRRKLNGEYLLSMKDLCTLHEVPDLMEAGIDSLKIEGRMKNEYYVAATVDAYKTMVEDVRQGCFTHERAAHYEERMKDIFHRGGFTHGYLHQQCGPDMIDPSMPGRAGVPVGEIRACGKGEIRIHLCRNVSPKDALEIRLSTEEEPLRLTSPVSGKTGEEVTLKAAGTRRLSTGMTVFRVRNASLQQELEDRILNRPPRIPVTLSLTLHAGEPVDLKAEAKGIYVDIKGMRAEKAAARPVTDTVIRDKIGSLSETDFHLKELTIENDGESFLPAGELKKLRRDVLLDLKEKLIRRNAAIPNPDSSEGEMEKDDNLMPSPRFLSMTVHGKMIRTSEIRKPAAAGQIICHVTHIRQARLLLLLPNRPDVIIFRNDLRFMDPDEIALFARQKKDVRLIAGFPAIYRDIIPQERMDRLYRLSTELDGVYLPGLDSYAWFRDRSSHDERQKGKLLILGEALYRCNSLADVHFREDTDRYPGEVWMEAPYELGEGDGPSSDLRMVYGCLPMMRTAQMPGQTAGERFSLDGQDYLSLYPNSELCYNNILSSRPVISETMTEGKAYLFTDEDEKRMERILKGDADLSHHTIRHKGLL